MSMQDTKAVIVTPEEIPASIPGLPEWCTVTSTAMIIRDGVPYEDWHDLVCLVQNLVRRKEAELNTSRLWLGDLLRYGELQPWSDMLSQAVLDSGYARQTCANSVWVASKVDPSRRRETLSFGHHAEVAPLPPKEQEHWLQEAEEKELSVKALRREIRHAKDRSNGKDPSVGDAERSLALSFDEVSDSPPGKWAELILSGLIIPLKRRCAEAEFFSFLAMLEVGIKELLMADLSKLTVEEMREDRAASVEDMEECEFLLSVTEVGLRGAMRDGSSEDVVVKYQDLVEMISKRIDGNAKIIAVIDQELARRGVEIGG